MAKDVPSIEGVPDPRKMAELHKENAVSGDKFKRIMKVDESDEAEKRRKRNLSKQEEEEEVDDTEETKRSPTPFGAYGGGNRETIFSREGAGIPPPSASDVSEDPTPYTIPSAELPTEQGEELFPVPLTLLSPTNQNALPPQTDLPKEKEKVKDKEKGKPSPSSPITLEHLAAKSPGKKSGVISPTKKEKKKEVVEGMTSFEPEKPKMTLPFTAAKEKTEEKLLQRKPAPSETSKEKPHEEPATNLSFAGPDAMFNLGPTETIASPTYAMLPKQVFELFERMVGYLMIEQTKGVSSTTVKLSMPGSVFHGCEVVIDHYDTAPHSYNIQFLGTPSAVTLFSTHMQDLAAAFQHSRFAFTVHLQTPVLLEESRPVLKRKGKSGDKDSGSGSKKGR